MNWPSPEKVPASDGPPESATGNPASRSPSHSVALVPSASLAETHISRSPAGDHCTWYMPAVLLASGWRQALFSMSTMFMTSPSPYIANAPPSGRQVLSLPGATGHSPAVSAQKFQ